MRILCRFVELSWQERRLVILAVLFLILLKPALGVFSIKSLLRFSEGALLLRGRLRSRHGASPDGAAWAVSAVACRVPTLAKCLARALALKMLLSVDGYRSFLHIGVARAGSGRLQAHAWLEFEGRILIGSPECDRYASLPSFDRGGT